MFRRDFLRHLLVVSAAAGAPPLMAACAEDKSTDPADQARVFPQGLASGDPKPDSVLLWTRVEPATAAETLSVSFEIALDENFEEIIISGDTEATADSDHTVRLKATGLSPYTFYYFRFSAEGVQSVVGRTKTAPAPDQDVDVRLAFCTCQDFNGRYYHAWEALLAEPDVDFVLFLGDYVYETEGNPLFQDPTGDRFISVPDGLELGSGDDSYNAAVTLADYRSLYKQYRSDETLQKVHQRYPFVTIWDDHEFANDSWQDHATDFDGAQGEEQSTERRELATRAWFEYQPVDVSYDQAAGYPNDIKIYRNLRFGRHVELIVTDQRYYRSDHVIPEGPLDLDVAKLFENSSLGSRLFVLKSGFDPKEIAASPTMLGAEQKQWLLDTLQGSSATWKLWGSETQLAQYSVDLSDFMQLPENYRESFYLSTDQWDGYRSERAEILSAIEGVENVVALVGDVHATYASELYADFDNPGAPAAVEYVVAGISSSPIKQSVKRQIDNSDTLTAVGLGELVDDFDPILQQSCPHIHYANSDINGVAIATVSASEMRVDFLHVTGVMSPTWDGNVTRVSFRTLAGQKSVEQL